jgi:RNA polymerase sigma-70 factor (ECF subfamily)
LGHLIGDGNERRGRHARKAEAAAGGEAAVRTIIRQNNRRLSRMARAIMKDDKEAEDVVRES